MYKYYLFDLDGTLSQSEPGIFNCIKYALKSYDIPVPTDEVLRSFIGPSLYHSFTHTIGAKPELAKELVKKYRERYNVIGLYETEIYEGIPETLKVLKASGTITAVATSKPTEPTRMILDKFDLSKYFDVVVGSNPDGTGSDKQLIISEALRKMREISDEKTEGTPDNAAGKTENDKKTCISAEKKDALMIGDRMYDIKGGHACGTDTVGVLYGYGSKEEFEEAGADFIVEKPEDILLL